MNNLVQKMISCLLASLLASARSLDIVLAPTLDTFRSPTCLYRDRSIDNE